MLDFLHITYRRGCDALETCAGGTTCLAEHPTFSWCWSTVIEKLSNLLIGKFQMEIKPFLLNNVLCEGCNETETHHLCPELCCLLFLCQTCWFEIHKERGLLHHRPMTIKSSRILSEHYWSRDPVNHYYQYGTPNQRGRHREPDHTCYWSKFHFCPSLDMHSSN